MNKIEITRTNGNIPKALPNNDHISAFVFVYEDAMDDAVLLSSVEDFTLESVKKLFGDDTTEDDMHYKTTASVVKQFYAMAPGASLWVGAYSTDDAVVKMQRKAGGEIRQMAAFADDVNVLISNVKKLEQEDMPLSVLIPVMEQDVDFFDTELPVNERISLVAGYEKIDSTSLSIVGYALGAVAAAAVNESISWVRKFPVPVSNPTIAATPISEINQAVLDAIDQKGYIFLRSYTGLNGYYFNDSRTMADPISDYNTIEAVRTMDKVVRGIRTYLLPELGAPLKLDPETGCLAPETVKYLETVASQQLTAMEKAGEISGWSVEIDPAQNVLATSTVEFVVKNVPIGVMRKAAVKIGYAQSV